MTFDVVIVGGGPAGLSCAIRVKQQAALAGREVSVCVLDKGAEIGALDVDQRHAMERNIDYSRPMRGGPIDCARVKPHTRSSPGTSVSRRASWDKSDIRERRRCSGNRGGVLRCRCR